eukprot:CAMPEP_0198242354 /NCGR_PEP_ID=MMETSP1446-20131203/15287_1 /TAXON_ID=1461542 ORGANISM="Unidentified sp, Strain CCMP2111" /NCGR_SAMPLE_ID=MMETSP1446 /ASSEMBLY_ACC=CAM_ASM_001112 /LENGTH=53 /DNA_ID=CAMNT_0043925775 /DNA_START=138 /DNA_END=296 /DNA_ORIENTATION=-
MTSPKEEEEKTSQAVQVSGLPGRVGGPRACLRGRALPRVGPPPLRARSKPRVP